MNFYKKTVYEYLTFLDKDFLIKINILWIKMVLISDNIRYIYFSLFRGWFNKNQCKFIPVNITGHLQIMVQFDRWVL